MAIPRTPITVPQAQRASTAIPGPSSSKPREQSVFPDFSSKGKKREEPEISLLSSPPPREIDGPKIKLPDPYNRKDKGKAAKQWLMRMSTYVALNARRFQNEQQAIMW